MKKRKTTKERSKAVEIAGSNFRIRKSLQEIRRRPRLHDCVAKSSLSRMLLTLM
jgi:hypothetical protein